MNSASAFEPVPFGSIDVAAWDAMFAVNVRAPFRLWPGRAVRGLGIGGLVGSGRTELLRAKDHGEAFALLQSGRADAFLMDEAVLYGLIAVLLAWPLFLADFAMYKVQGVVRDVLTDDTRIKAELMELQLKLELGDIDDDQYVAYEADLMRQLRDMKISVMVETFGTENVDPGKIEQAITSVFDLRPAALVSDLKLRDPDNSVRPSYRKTAAYGHFGREEPEFTWERTDKAAALRAAATNLHGRVYMGSPRTLWRGTQGRDGGGQRGRCQ